jgi:4-hydroxy-tetrahydrodipicolinate synthase
VTKYFTGTSTALVTPFNRDGSIDWKAFEKLLAWQIESGVNNIVVSGTTGESVTLAEEEFSELIQNAKKIIGKKIPLIAGSGTNSTEKSIQMSKRAEQCGADGLLLVGPYYNKPTQEGYFQHFAAIAKAVNLPVIVYNVPGRTGGNILPETILRLAKIDNIVAIKEASGNITQMMELKQKLPENFSILSGEDALTLAMLALGADGVISVVSNEIPQEFSHMVTLARKGEWSAAQKLHYRFLDLMNINFVESNPIPVKYALAKMGQLNEVYRLPLVPLSENNKAKVDTILKNLNLI